jgi:hypothetical protein
LERNPARKSDFDIKLATIKELRREYKKRAKKKNLEFNLTVDEFYRLVQLKCFYCHSNLQSKRGYRGDRSIKVPYNGLDRVDNLKGYTLENVVTCCWICNQWKKNFSVKDFIKHVKNISSNLEGLNKWMMEKKLNA